MSGEPRGRAPHLSVLACRESPTAAHPISRAPRPAPHLSWHLLPALPGAVASGSPPPGPSWAPCFLHGNTAPAGCWGVPTCVWGLWGCLVTKSCQVLSTSFLFFYRNCRRSNNYTADIFLEFGVIFSFSLKQGKLMTDFPKLSFYSLGAGKGVRT